MEANTKPETPNNPSALWNKAKYTWDAMGNILSASLAEVEPGGPDELSATNPKRFQPPNKARKQNEAIVQPLGRTMQFSYDGTTPIITAVTLNDLSHSMTHDEVGNETYYVVTRSYSPRNLLRQVTDVSEPENLFVHSLTYEYDGRGVRATRAESSSNGPGTVARRYYVYTPELTLLAASRDDSPNVWGGNPPSTLANNIDYEIVWFGNRPVAQVSEPNGTRAYTFADHLGTPILQTDATRTVTWRVEYEPFGNVYEVRAGTRTDQPLRFPGQELGMTWEGPEENYNIFRWYKGGWGRYTQADPIGLTGGSNLFAYADDDPIASDDPLGLASKKPKTTKPPKAPPPTDCATICNMAYADSTLNQGGGGVVCLNGIKCPCAFDVAPARRGECPELDADVIEHEKKHIRESACPDKKLCRATFAPPMDARKRECEHRRASTLNLMRAINSGFVTPSCKQKLNVIVPRVQSWIWQNCR